MTTTDTAFPIPQFDAARPFLSMAARDVLDAARCNPSDAVAIDHICGLLLDSLLEEWRAQDEWDVLEDFWIFELGADGEMAVQELGDCIPGLSNAEIAGVVADRFVGLVNVEIADRNAGLV